MSATTTSPGANGRHLATPEACPVPVAIEQRDPPPDAHPKMSPAPDEREVAGWLALIIDPGQTHELRAPKVTFPGSKKPVDVVEYFDADHLLEMAREALRLSGLAPAIYYTINPVRPELAGGRRSARAVDVIHRRRLLIDIDSGQPRGVSATDAEKAASLAVAVAARDYLTALGAPRPIVADSGNGWHLIYAVDLANDAPDGLLVKAMLVSLAARFNSAAAEVDTKVHDPARLIKLHGTAARKGEETAERPHRISRVVEIPRAFTTFPRELIEAIASEATATAVASPKDGPTTPARKRDVGNTATPRDGTTIPLPERLDRGRKLLDKCEPAVSDEGGHDKLFKVACHLGPGLDLPADDALALLREVYNLKCLPPWSDDELRHKVENAYRLEPRPRGWLLDAPRSRVNGRAHVDDDVAASGPPMDGGDRLGSSPPADGPGDLRRVDDADSPVNEAPDDPHRLARSVLADFSHRDGSTLVWYRETFHVWDGSAYRPDPSLMNRVVALVKAEVDRQNRAASRVYREQAGREVLAPSPGRPSKPPVATRVTRRLIADVVQALASMTGIAEQEAEPPFWLRARPGDPEPSGIVPASNGLVVLDAEGGPTSWPHTPRFFSTHTLPYPHDPDAPEPSAWLKFLDDVWPDDPASARELQKWFGYALTPDIDQQRILLLVGSPGSGRSTIKDVLSAVVGRRNVVSTSAVALADRFGLEPFMGKTLAILGDARSGDSRDTAVMMDRLLRISGGDPVEVNRKGKPILHDVLMRTRLMIVSNEMPNFRDASKAIVRRYLPLCTPRSFEGREDRTLARGLLRELPGLLNWAIAGRELLALDGRFIVPPSSEDLIDEAKALASPVAEFVAEECTVAAGEDATVEELWKRWKEWAERSGHQPSHRHLFGRNLRAATGFKIKISQPRENDSRFRIYKGIGLKVAREGGGPY